MSNGHLGRTVPKGVGTGAETRSDQAGKVASVTVEHQGRTLTSGAPAVNRHAFRQRMKRVFACTLAYLVFCLLMISLQPFDFTNPFVAVESKGDRLNQFGYLIAGSITVLGLLTLVNRRLLAIFTTPGWAAMGFVLVLSMFAASNSIDASRSIVLTLIGMVMAASIVLLPPDEKSFQGVSAAAILTIMGLSYFGVVFLPAIAIHGDDLLHVGRWRGHFSHKNIASPIMSVFVMFAIYLWRSKMFVTGAVIFLLAVLFVFQAGAKSTNGLLPIAIFVVLAGRIFGLPLLTIGLYALAVAAVGALTVGTLYSDALARITASVLSDPTFTGRLTLWEYGLENITGNVWFGNGFDSFWGTSVVKDTESPFDRAWDFRGISNGHNNFIDMVLVGGVVGALILFWAVFIAPSVNYIKSNRHQANRNLADLCMMIVVFMTLLSFLETFLIGRINPVWLCLIIAVTGLQLTSRYRIV